MNNFKIPSHSCNSSKLLRIESLLLRSLMQYIENAIGHKNIENGETAGRREFCSDGSRL